MSKEANKIVFEFDNAQDAKEVMDLLIRKTEITWNEGTKIAMVKGNKKTMTLLVSKSVYKK